MILSRSKADSTLATHRVYIDGDGTIFDVSLNQTNVGSNNNKFYRIQILEGKNDGAFCTWTRWGRVGERGLLRVVSCRIYGLTCWLRAEQTDRSW